MNKKLTKSILFLFVVVPLVFVSCATTRSKAPKAVLIERPERMFWEIKSDKGTVYILGTIHMVFQEGLVIEDSVLKCFDTADRLVAEISNKDIKNLQTEIVQRFQKSITPKNAKSTTRDALSKEEIKTCLKVLDKPSLLFALQYEPWVLNMMLQKGLGETKSLKKGIDFDLFKRAGLRPIEALDTIKTQLDLITFGNKKEQEILLHETIKLIEKESVSGDKLFSSQENIIQAYYDNDKIQLAKHIENSITFFSGTDSPLRKKYSKVLFVDRNKDWVKKIERYLRKDETTFIFAGAGHFCGKDSVFEIMKEKNLIQ